MDGVVLPANNARSISFPPAVDAMPKSAEINQQQTRSHNTNTELRREEDSQKETLQAVNFANAVAELFDKKIEFSYDERIQQVVVKIMEGNSEEVIRQIPPEEIIELVAKLREDFRGLIFDQKG